MGFLNRLFQRKDESPSAVEVAEPQCPHVALTPHWDSAEDIGHSEKITRYECESCKASFPREEGERLRDAGAERLRISEEERRERLTG